MEHEMIPDNVIPEIEKLYGMFPAVACKGCGQCCVCPTCMLSEFIYLISYARSSLPADEFARYILAPAVIHPDYDGNLICVFLDNARCPVHGGRTSGCRLFGLSALRDLGIADMVYCRNNIDALPGPADVKQVRTWLEMLVRLESTLYDFAAEPYMVQGFNIHCWLDIYFDATFDDCDVFADIRNIMRKYIDLSEFAARYIPQTGLKEKVDKITILSSMQGRADIPTVKALLNSIRNDYPATGTYYYTEAQRLIDSM
jgi:Fe-S-cluster containining protein